VGTTTDFEKVRALAAALGNSFISIKGPDGEPLTRDRCEVRSIMDTERARWQEVCHEAHGDMFPDDWRYSMIEEAADMLSEAENEDDYQDRVGQAEAPIMNVDLLGYIGSHGARFNGYADEAIAEYDPKDFMQICGMAWHIEFQEVASLLLSALSEMADDEPEADEDEAVNE
jgi:hypothetical protein